MLKSLVTPHINRFGLIYLILHKGPSLLIVVLGNITMLKVYMEYFKTHELN